MMSSSVWSALVGPCYTAKFLRELRPRTPAGEPAEAEDLLCAAATDGTLAYPVYQFDENRCTLPHLREVLDMLRPALPNDWSILRWFNTPLPEADGRTAAELLRGSPIEVAWVLEMAMADAAARRR